MKKSKISLFEKKSVSVKLKDKIKVVVVKFVSGTLVQLQSPKSQSFKSICGTVLKSVTFFFSGSEISLSRKHRAC